jgi:hypothetical protein
MKRLVRFFPELRPFYERELAIKHRYYSKLFEAIGAALYHWREQAK